jgi:membrane protease YdiL (CAAX protease family)
MPRQEFYYQRPIWGLMLSTTLVAVLFTWLYNNTRGSILAALLFHTMFNLSLYLFPTLGSDRATLYLFGLLFIGVIVILIVWGPKRMVRGERKA